MSYMPAPTLTKVLTLNLNQTNTDLASIVVPLKTFLASVRLYSASANLATSSALFGVYDAVAGGGNVLVTPALVTSLTTTSKMLNMTMAYTDLITTGLVVARVTTAAGITGTINVVFNFFDLT